MVGDYSICLIDEVQFFTDAVAFLHRTRSFKDLKLFFSGLNYDVHRRPFPVTYTLSLLCDQVITLRSRCYKCTSDAEYTVFEGNNTDAGDGNFIHVGTEGYKAICGSCFWRNRKKKLPCTLRVHIHFPVLNFSETMWHPFEWSEARSPYIYIYIKKKTGEKRKPYFISRRFFLGRRGGKEGFFNFFLESH